MHQPLIRRWIYSAYGSFYQTPIVLGKLMPRNSQSTPRLLTRGRDYSSTTTAWTKKQMIKTGANILHKNLPCRTQNIPEQHATGSNNIDDAGIHSTNHYHNNSCK